tara:strand:+ start:74 stop:733 length:660 start_codon:yes stop_codon:yes gene_type:complete
MIKNIIFDFDGVLVDSEILVSKSIKKYLSKRNIDFEEDNFSKYVGNKTINIVSNLSSKFNIKDEQAFFNEIMRMTKELYKTELKPIDGVIDFIKKTNYNKLIGSNNISERILYGLKKTNLNLYFKAKDIFAFDLVGIPKPHPDIYLRAIKDNSIKKSETIIIEDSVAGVSAGVAAGVKVIGITAGSHWYNGRSDKELYDAGAYDVVNKYEDVLLTLEKL